MTIKKNEDTGPGGKMVTATESDVVRAVKEPERLNHKEAKRAAVFQEARRCILCQEKVQWCL